MPHEARPLPGRGARITAARRTPRQGSSRRTAPRRPGGARRRRRESAVTGSTSRHRMADRKCPSGRTLMAFEGGVHARLDDMKKVRGIIVYPRRIEELVRPHAEVDEFEIVVRGHERLDDILVRIDPSRALSRAERDGLGAARREPAHGAGAAGQRGDHRARRAPALGPQGPAREGRAHRGVGLTRRA